MKTYMRYLNHMTRRVGRLSSADLHITRALVLVLLDAIDREINDRAATTLAAETLVAHAYGTTAKKETDR